MADTTSISKIKIGQQEYLIKDNDARVALGAHTSDTANPHGVTASQVGLGNVENKSSATIRGEITAANVTTALGYTPISPAEKGVVNGVATLDATGKVPSAQLPSFVDDVVEGYLYNGKFYKESTHTTEIPGESDKIYVNLEGGANVTYRWGGSSFVEVGSSLALGETSGTAYRGDRGKIAYDHATETKLSTATASGLYKVAATAEGHVAGLTPVQKSDITDLGVPAQDTTYSAGTGLSLSGTTINHSNSVTPGNDSPSIDSSNRLVIGNVSYDSQGHVTTKGNTTISASGTTTASGSVSKPSFTGTQATISAKFTPAGTVSTPNVTVTESKSSFLSSVASAGTTPQWSASVDTATETLSFSWSAGAMPTFNSSNAMVGASAALASAPTFTGTEGTVSASYTPAGSVSQPSFTGSSSQVDVSFAKVTT